MNHLKHVWSSLRYWTAKRLRLLANWVSPDRF